MFNYDSMHYRDVLKDMDSVMTSFDCQWPCKFLATLADAGHDGFLTVVAARNDRRNSESILDGKYSIEGLRACDNKKFADITITKNTDEDYSVLITVTGDVLAPHKPHKPFASAVASMGG